ncbi:hypothetical protein F511_39970 [Dorcoceras hygrometricum]|uniref:Uncharacterized protein n=1 Tax=Dorcoceras hygrometricum TaxID=472368 RepID=A0A2Z7A9I1_9LAMI|nr:hypothetical protein F511_39970 [Dorcoceras hygrometricum]
MASESELIKIAREGFEIIEKYFVKRPPKARLHQAYAPSRNYPARGPEPNNHRYVYHPQESLVVYQHAAADASVITGHDAAFFSADNNLRRNPMRTAY